MIKTKANTPIKKTKLTLISILVGVVVFAFFLFINLFGKSTISLVNYNVLYSISSVLHYDWYAPQNFEYSGDLSFITYVISWFGYKMNFLSAWKIFLVSDAVIRGLLSFVILRFVLKHTNYKYLTSIFITLAAVFVSTTVSTAIDGSVFKELLVWIAGSMFYCLYANRKMIKIHRFIISLLVPMVVGTLILIDFRCILLVPGLFVAVIIKDILDKKTTFIPLAFIIGLILATVGVIYGYYAVVPKIFPYDISMDRIENTPQFFVASIKDSIAYVRDGHLTSIFVVLDVVVTNFWMFSICSLGTIGVVIIGMVYRKKSSLCSSLFAPSLWLLISIILTSAYVGIYNLKGIYYGKRIDYSVFSHCFNIDHCSYLMSIVFVIGLVLLYNSLFEKICNVKVSILILFIINAIEILYISFRVIAYITLSETDSLENLFQTNIPIFSYLSIKNDFAFIVGYFILFSLSTFLIIFIFRKQNSSLVAACLILTMGIDIVAPTIYSNYQVDRYSWLNVEVNGLKKFNDKYNGIIERNGVIYSNDALKSMLIQIRYPECSIIDGYPKKKDEFIYHSYGNEWTYDTSNDYLDTYTVKLDRNEWLVIKGSSLLQEFANEGVEFYSCGAQYEINNFVRNAYALILGRAVDKDGFDYYIQALLDGDESPERFAKALIFSEEFQNRKLKKKEIIQVVYILFVGEEPDEDTIQYFIDNAVDGNYLDPMLDEIVDKEYFDTIIKTTNDFNNLHPDDERTEIFEEA